MKISHLPSLFLVFFLPSYLSAQNPLELDWAELRKTKPWVATEQWEPVPKRVTPGQLGAPPADAIVLFDGNSMSSWHTPKLDYGARMDNVMAIVQEKLANPSFSEPLWEVKDGALIVNPGSGAIETKQSFGDCQLHIEWLSPVDPGKEGQGYSNSGIFFMGMYEIQVLNSYENETYPNGQAGSLYKQHIPLVNASRPPGEWQSYDIVFNAPKFDDTGSLLQPATVTAFHNGVLIQNDVDLKGPCVFIGEPHYIAHPPKLPLLLQDHGNKDRFRNIWIREL
ncbi:MAG: DUF1080 domain-containing protein [Saprospiraceae bacterium]|nr:DUF1080 domain-containing protein [Saprospiraceae bacterium]